MGEFPPAIPVFTDETGLVSAQAVCTYFRWAVVSFVQIGSVKRAVYLKGGGTNETFLVFYTLMVRLR